MRTGSTFLQTLFDQNANIHHVLKSRFFSYDPYYFSGKEYLESILSSKNTSSSIIIDSDENYSLGRFKTKLISYNDADFSFQKELQCINHDITEMADRLYRTVPFAKIVMIIREQRAWLKSVYKHDVYHYGLTMDFNSFLLSKLGKDYLNAGDYLNIWKIYASRFGKENVKFLLFEDLVKDKNGFFSTLETFLGVQFDKKHIQNEPKNQNYSDRLTWIMTTINLLSQKEVDKKERRLYYLLRRLVLNYFKNTKSKDFFPNNRDARFIHNYFGEGNKLLAEKLGFEIRMQEEGYY